MIVKRIGMTVSAVDSLDSCEFLIRQSRAGGSTKLPQFLWLTLKNDPLIKSDGL